MILYDSPIAQNKCPKNSYVSVSDLIIAIRPGIHKLLVRIENSEDPDQISETV